MLYVRDLTSSLPPTIYDLLFIEDYVLILCTSILIIHLFILSFNSPTLGWEGALTRGSSKAMTSGRGTCVTDSFMFPTYE